MKKILTILFCLALLTGCTEDELNSVFDSVIENKEQIVDYTIKQDQAELKTYKNEEFGFELMYPSNWMYNEYYSNEWKIIAFNISEDGKKLEGDINEPLEIHIYDTDLDIESKIKERYEFNQGQSIQSQLDVLSFTKYEIINTKDKSFNCISGGEYMLWTNCFTKISNGHEFILSFYMQGLDKSTQEQLLASININKD